MAGVPVQAEYDARRPPTTTIVVVVVTFVVDGAATPPASSPRIPRAAGATSPDDGVPTYGIYSAAARAGVVLALVGSLQSTL